MTDPRRIRDQAPASFEAQLLDAMRADQPSEDARARAALSVAGALIVTPVAAGTAEAAGVAHSPSAAAKLALSGAKSAVGGLAVKSTMLLVGGALAIGISLPTRPPPSHPSLRGSAPAAHSPPVQAATRAPEKVMPAPADDAPPMVAPAPRGRSARDAHVAPGARLPAVGVSVRTGTLAQEVAALSVAKRALAAGDAPAALAALQAYGQESPQGTLREESEVLRVEALSLGRDYVGAADLVTRLLAHDPAALYRSKLLLLHARIRAAADEQGIEVDGTGQ